MSTDTIICFFRLGRIFRWRREFVVHQDPMRRTFHILELPAPDRPQKNHGDSRNEHQAEGY